MTVIVEPARRMATRRRLLIAVEPYLYAAPAVVLLAAIMLVPLALGISYAFRDIELLNPFSGGFVGLEHFRAAWDDANFWNALRNTVMWTTVSVLLQFVFGLILALLRNTPFPGRGLVQALVFLPWAVPTFLSGLNWAWLLNPVVGPFPHWLFGLGLMSAPENILSDPKRALWGPIIAIVWWGIPFFAITLLAALQIDPARHLRGGGDRRSRQREALLLDHLAVPCADHRHHIAVARRLGCECGRADRGDDQWRAGRFDADRRKLHLHPGLPAPRFRLCVGDRGDPARPPSRLCLRGDLAAPDAQQGDVAPWRDEAHERGAQPIGPSITWRSRPMSPSRSSRSIGC